MQNTGIVNDMIGQKGWPENNQKINVANDLTGNFNFIGIRLHQIWNSHYQIQYHGKEM